METSRLVSLAENLSYGLEFLENAYDPFFKVIIEDYIIEYKNIMFLHFARKDYKKVINCLDRLLKITNKILKRLNIYKVNFHTFDKYYYNVFVDIKTILISCKERFNEIFR